MIKSLYNKQNAVKHHIATDISNNHICTTLNLTQYWSQSIGRLVKYTWPNKMKKDLLQVFYIDPMIDTGMLQWRPFIARFIIANIL